MQDGLVAIRALWLLLLPLAPLHAAPAPQCTSGPPTTTGTVTVLAQGLPGQSTLPRTTLDVLRIDCDGMPPMGCSLLVSEPDPALPLRGTILVNSGNIGTVHYGSWQFGAMVLQRLQAQGFRIVDRAWTPSWLSQGISLRKQSCYYATLLHWVHANKHTTGRYGAMGGSGAAAEIAYALSTWDGGDVLDFAVLMGGPPMARLDLQCPNPPSAAWLAQCNQLLPTASTCTEPNCHDPDGFQLCTMCSTTPSLAELRDDSVLHLNAVTHYPDTTVHLINGAADCFAVSSMLFFQAVTSEIVIEFVPGLGHTLATSQEGRDAIVRAVLGAGASIPRPASLAFRDWPRLGGTLELDLHGQPGDPYFVLWSMGTSMTEVGPFGWFFLTYPFPVIGSGTLNSGSGRATSTLPISLNPALTGFEIYAQGLVGTSLTNMVRFEILP